MRQLLGWGYKDCESATCEVSKVPFPYFCYKGADQPVCTHLFDEVILEWSLMIFKNQKISNF